MKRVLSLVLALSMVLGMFSFAFAGSSLKDITGTEYEAAVEALVKLGVVNGYTDGTYLPEKVVSRAEMAKFLVVAAGLEPAADVAKGATRFSDVTGDHWASGYINVAAEYGYIVGYPDGTFNPDAAVTYAEAVTMALRVLGYRTVVESKGTWPTNYIARAQDLKMLDEISYGSYSDGAKRGNVAKLVWNMLRTRMWEVTGESEGDGLQYSKSSKMLEVKFPDYSYDEVEFKSFEIKDGDVYVQLSGDSTKYEYDGADFYTLVKGTEVEVLINDKDDVLLTIVPTGRDEIVEGTKEDLEDEDYTHVPEADYIYAMIEDDDVVESTKLNVTSKYVYEVKDSTSGIRINGGSTIKEKDYKKKVVIKDGSRISYGDIEEGDVISTVTVNGNEFYVISNNKAEGKLTKYNSTKGKMTIGGTSYTEANAEYVENPEKNGGKKGDNLASAVNKDSKLGKAMNGEEVVAYLDFLGRVVRIDFDGNIGDDTSTDVNFYAVKSLVEKERAGVYVITLENEDGEKEFTFEKNNAVAVEMFSNDEDVIGSYAVVEFNDDEEITNIATFARPTSGDPYYKKPSADLLAYGEDADEKYEIKELTHGHYDKDEETIGNLKDTASQIICDDDVILVTLTYDDNGTEKTSDDEYEVSFEEGLEALESIKDEFVLVIYDADEDITTAKYVVRFDDAKNTDDILAGKVEDVTLNGLGGDYYLTVDGDEDLTYRKSDNDLGSNIEDYENGAILYSFKEDKDGDEYLIFEGGLTYSTLKNADKNATDYVVKRSGKIVKFANAGQKTITNDSYQNEYDDYLFVVVEITSEEGVNADKLVTDVHDPIKTEDLTADDFSDGDRIIKDATDKVVFIIRGLDEREDAAQVVQYTITATAGDNGSISPEGEVVVDAGADKTFTITANEGYAVESVLVDGEAVELTSEYTFTSVDAAHTIAVTFAEQV